MIFTAVKNSISYNSTIVKNNESNVTLLLVVVEVVMVVVVVAAPTSVNSKLCHTDNINRLYRPVLVE